MSEKKIPLDELLEFPCSFTFRVVAAAAPGLEERCSCLVEAQLGRALDEVGSRLSKEGNWCSVRLQATVRCGDEITDAYQALRGVPGLKMLL